MVQNYNLDSGASQDGMLLRHYVKMVSPLETRASNQDHLDTRSRIPKAVDAKPQDRLHGSPCSSFCRRDPERQELLPEPMPTTSHAKTFREALYHVPTSAQARPRDRCRRGLATLGGPPRSTPRNNKAFELEPTRSAIMDAGNTPGTP